jgi:hypothetical protein
MRRRIWPNSFDEEDEASDCGEIVAIMAGESSAGRKPVK